MKVQRNGNILNIINFWYSLLLLGNQCEHQEEGGASMEPEYEYITSQPKNFIENFEMEGNIAYGPLSFGDGHR